MGRAEIVSYLRTFIRFLLLTLACGYLLGAFAAWDWCWFTPTAWSVPERLLFGFLVLAAVFVSAIFAGLAEANKQRSKRYPWP
jgi:fatty acid desaturase